MNDRRLFSRRSIAAAAALAPLGAPALIRSAHAQGRTEIQFWHAMTSPLGDIVNDVVKKFNDSQSTYTVTPVFKGGYVETLTNAIAAWRAGQAPHIVQMFEVGTGSMIAAGPAIKPTHQLFAEAGMTVDVNQYLPGVRGYYSNTQGQLMSMPFNSSTAVMWYNKDAFRAAGLDPERPPATWPEVRAAATKLAQAKATPSPMTTSWPTWIQFEQFSAIHNVPYATLANGFGGLGAELRINSPLHVRQLTTLAEMAKEGTFKYGGRNNTPDPLFTSGECAIGFGSSAGRAQIVRDAKFAWAAGLLPFYPDAVDGPSDAMNMLAGLDPQAMTPDQALAALKQIKAANTAPGPINSVIGGASLWVMTAPNRRPEEYKAAAEFFGFISRPEIDAEWHQRTGYVPITFGGYELSKAQGFYEKNPGTDLPIHQLTRGTMTDNSKGFRLGRMVEIRSIIEEEMEKTLQGGQTPQQAMDNAVSRGNRVLREFERQNRG
jgi:sn-glycerol 3-phosphate transport system substrate-binding protein